MQVRRADQALYHHELTVSSLGSVCQSCTAPLHENRKSKFMNSQNKKLVQQSTDRSFTSIQMVHTHASLPRGCFLATAGLATKLLFGPGSRI